MTSEHEVEDAGGVRIGGCDAAQLAHRYGTPLYVYDEDGLRRGCRRYRAAFERARPGSVVSYAAKAFSAVEMLRLAHEEGLGLDAASTGELAAAHRAGVAPHLVTVHGAAKKAEDLQYAVDLGVGHIAVDALAEIEDLIEVCRRRGRVQRVLLRVNPGTAVDTDARYRTSGADCKFGLSLADGSAHRAFTMVRSAPQLRLDGLHFHLGSQLMELAPYVDAMRRLAAFVRELDACRPERIVVGGGMGVRYTADQHPPTPEAWADGITRAFAEILEPVCADGVVLGIEPGRSVVAEHGSTLYRVGSVKPSLRRPASHLLVVDGGLSDNPRPLMYSATHRVSAVMAPAGDGIIADIYGRHCETDLLFSGVPLPPVGLGDILLVETTGAYVQTMASNYNRFLRPAVVFVRDGASRVVVRRETPEDLLLLESAA